MISVSSKFIKYHTDSLLLWFLILLLLVQYKSIRSGNNIVKKTIRDKNKKRQTSCDVKGRRPTLIQPPVWPLGGTLTSPMYTMAIMVAFTHTRSYPFYLQYLSIYLSIILVYPKRQNKFRSARYVTEQVRRSIMSSYHPMLLSTANSMVTIAVIKSAVQQWVLGIIVDQLKHSKSFSVTLTVQQSPKFDSISYIWLHTGEKICFSMGNLLPCAANSAVNTSKLMCAFRTNSFSNSSCKYSYQ